MDRLIGRKTSSIEADLDGDLFHNNMHCIDGDNVFIGKP